MHRLALTVLALLVLSGSARAQRQAEIFGGYSYANVDIQSGVPSSSPIPRQSANGWEVAPAFNANQWLGIEGNFGGYYKTVPASKVAAVTGIVSDLKVHAYSFAGGPRVNYRQKSATAFVHALVGGDSLSGSISGLGSASQNTFEFAVGGGVAWKVRPLSHWAVRGSADYVLTKHNIISKLLSGVNSSLTQNNFRTSVGLVYEFGSIRESAPRPQKASSTAQGCAGSSEAALLGITGCSEHRGVRVSSIQSNSPAARAGIRPGDMITSIDGRPIQNIRDIELATGASATGTVKVEYMIQGNFLTVREAKIR